MKLSLELNSALNAQVLHEYRNMLVYKHIQSVFEDLQYKNLASFFGKQAQQEKEHGDKFLQHINDRTGGKAEIGEVSHFDIQLNSISDIARQFIDVEEGTTESIEEIYELALTTKSFIDLPFLQEMLAEQVEEEDLAQNFATRILSTKDIALFDAVFEK